MKTKCDRCGNYAPSDCGNPKPNRPNEIEKELEKLRGEQ